MNVERYYTASTLAGLPAMPNTKSEVIRCAQLNGWSIRKQAKSTEWEYSHNSLPLRTQSELLRREALI